MYQSQGIFFRTRTNFWQNPVKFRDQNWSTSGDEIGKYLFMLSVDSIFGAKYLELYGLDGAIYSFLVLFGHDISYLRMG
jgi:hypothetical protein